MGKMGNMARGAKAFAKGKKASAKVARAGKGTKLKAIPQKTGNAASSGFGTTKRPATRVETAKASVKKKGSSAVKPFGMGRKATRGGATRSQVSAGTTSKRMKTGAAAGAAEKRAERGVSRTKTKAPGTNRDAAGLKTTSRGGTSKTTVRLGAPGVKSNRSVKNLSSGATNRKSTTYTVSRKAAAGAAAGGTGVTSVGGYTTYKRQTKSGKVVTVRRKK